ncbi:conjugal transfer protein TraO (plasmid) [Xanthomonas hydrangeae]|uniref:TrbG/VirB9 family P-type conjugative transfer protein n=1 Tax=Xanthomonas hydrangeae TaxID=2775159 RepID=UPI001964B298|nr:conjugal transfer protein TraO [Xanthomonas hydrangeae]CAD7741294.1 conjugal transfer protein TraO [Xanthomonas hydrangeae]CAD7747926.1 conjugal transfer protein TraO [Xanthomonas hydrangeae]CAD7747927.1 conjugal transfer protein TraO [Xanthomonas hydrangeae]CAD7748196.1 conjugal transfer protein TraO [Xanthomonas hydrangeae]
MKLLQKARSRRPGELRLPFWRTITSVIILMPVTLALASASASVPASVPGAKKLPDPKPAVLSTERDARFRVMDYDPDRVYDVTVHVGYQVDLMFAPGEEPIEYGVVLGDPEAWSFAVAANHVFLKPKATDGNTNLTVVTNRGRTYAFMLFYAQRRPTEKTVGTALNMRIQFRYPDDERAVALAAASKPDPLMAAERLARTERSIRNINYYACGQDEVNPDTIFDDGRFTYLRYQENRELPSIFVVNDDGSENLVNSRVAPDDPETIIVQRIAKRFVFRHGKTVGCVVNKGYDPQGPAGLTGTVDPGVVRIIKGANGGGQ